MKYRSLHWWIKAIKEQFKHYLRNIICRKWFKIEFGYTEADLLSLHTEANKEFLYSILISKYPDLKRIKKYMKIGRAFTVEEFNNASVFFQSGKRISVFWSDEFVLDDIFFLIDNQIICNVIITNVLGNPHSITITGYDDETDEILFCDPLGAPKSKYKIVYGYNVIYSKEAFIKSVGKKIRLSFVIKSSELEVIKKVKEKFSKIKLYSLEPRDIENGVIIENNRFMISKYSTDGKVKFDLGSDVENKFINIYGEYSDYKRDFIDYENRYC